MKANDLPERDGDREQAEGVLALIEALLAANLGAAFNSIINIGERGLIQTINPAAEGKPRRPGFSTQPAWIPQSL